MRAAVSSFVLAMSVLLVTSPSTAHAQLIVDGSFNTGTWTSTRFGPAGATNVTVNASGGNPGAYVNFSLQAVNNSDNVYVTYIKQNYTNTNALAGQSFSMQIDRSSLGGNGFPGTGFALQQGANIWYYTGSELGSYFSTAWLTGTINGTFNPGSFALLTGSGTPNFSAGTSTKFGFYVHLNNPNFSAGTSTKFGFYVHLNNPAGTHGMSYDNWSLSSATLSSVPEPSSLWLGGMTGLIGGAATFWKSRRRSARAA